MDTHTSEITRVQQLEELLRKSEMILDVMTSCQKDFIPQRDEKVMPSIIQRFLRTLLHVTNAQQGLISVYPIPPQPQLIIWGTTDPLLFSYIQSLCQQVIHTKRQVTLEIPNNNNSLHIKYFWGIPLLMQNQVEGVVALCHSQPFQYDEDILIMILPILQNLIMMLEALKVEYERKIQDMKLREQDEAMNTCLKVLEMQNHELEAARDEALKANQAKSSFLADISHEIRTPLNGIMGMSELLLNTELNPRQTKYAHALYQSGENLLALVNDVLDISKIEAGELKLEIIPINLTTILQEVASLLSLKAFEKGLEFFIYYDPTLPTQFMGDPTRLREILINLLGNAVKFTDQGYVYLRVALKDKLDPRILLLRLEIQDTGIGISQDKQKLLFTKFSQADSSTTRKYGGTGLGLAISKQLVEKMGGAIGVCSEEGNGSTFFVELPLTVVSEEPYLSTPKALMNQKILLINKCAMSQKILTSYFKHWDVIAAVCESWEQAHELLKLDQSYFAIIWNTLPNDTSNGLLFSKYVGSMKIIKLGWGKDEDIRYPLYTFLSKPIFPLDLQTALLQKD